jgi:hypothetical protein
MVDSEIEAFKSRIDLRQYAASKGYQLDPRESWRGSAVMRKGGRGGDKIIIKRNANGHFIYFSVRDDNDNGTIIDFIQHRDRSSLGNVRKELRPWLGQTLSPALPVFSPLERSGKNRHKVELEYSAMSAAGRSDYLELERGLPAGLFDTRRFEGSSRTDARGNVIFPHFDGDGLCGYEIKNRNFTGFASGGEKGLWLSNELPADRRLVFCESAIECLSFAVLFPDATTRFASLGGQVNPKQPDLIQGCVKRLPAAGSIAAAMNADKAGRELAEVVREALAGTGAHPARFTVLEPERENDWNDELRSRFPSGAPLSPALS